MSWKNWIRPVVFTIYIGLLCIALPLCIIELNKKNAPAIVVAWFVGGLFVMAAIPISLWTIIAHIIHYTKPYLQRHIIRILWMVPIYAVNAWFALRFQKEAIYLDTLRECYEAYVIYNFMAYLLSYLRHEYPDVEYMIEQKDPVRHLIPFCCCPAWPMGRTFIDRCRHGALQYTVIRPIMTVIAFICQLSGVYGEGEFNFKKAFIYIAFINNASQVWAMYCLIMFYKCCRDELRPISPVGKFICVKFVVFMSFWQAILISILTASGAINKLEIWGLNDPHSVANALQNFLICIEMFIAAVAHHFSFTYFPYVDATAPYRGWCNSCWSMCDVSDVKHDLVDHVRHVGNTVRQVVPRPGFTRQPQNHQQTLLNTERSPLINASDTDEAGSNTLASLAEELYRTRIVSEDMDSIGSTSSLTDPFNTAAAHPLVSLGLTGSDLAASMNNQLDASQRTLSTQVSVEREPETGELVIGSGFPAVV